MRGYEKKIIHLKNTGSRYFEEAYFIVKDNKNERCTSDKEFMVDEATRIIEENFNFYSESFFRRHRLKIIWGAVAAAVSAAAVVLLFLIF